VDHPAVWEMNVPNFPPYSLTPHHQVSAVRVRRAADLTSRIHTRVMELSKDESSFVLGVIPIDARNAVIVSQKPVQGNVSLSVNIHDKGAR
jgi:hypothetical protein